VRRAAGLAAALAAGAALAAAAQGAGPPRCEASAELVPARAYVGQQVHYQLRILRRRDVTSLEWETQLSFPTFRVEWLPTLSGDDRAAQGGETYLVFLERRALFAAHPGRLTVPSASLRCASPDGSEIASVPPVVLEVLELPAEGRPPGFAGLLGPLALSFGLTPERVALGGSLRLSVIAQGYTNLWSMPSPREALAAVPDVDVFEQPPELARDAGRALALRRYFHFDLVPRKAGVLPLPALRVPYFDPATGRYEEATAQLPALRVAQAPARPRAPGLPATAAETPRGPAPRLARFVALAAGLGALALAAGLLLRRRRQRAPGDDLTGRLAEARAAAARGEGDAASRAAAQALQLALAAARRGEGPPAGLEDAPGPLRDAARLLAQIERSRFAPGGAPPELRAVEAAIARLQERRSGGR
jgi:hypothetical protein